MNIELISDFIYRLVDYLQHKPSCLRKVLVYPEENRGRCTCGLDDLINEVKRS